MRMSALFRQIFSLLTAPPGNLIYHLVLVFSIASALQVTFVHWRSSGFPQLRRTMLGLGVLLAAQILIFGIGAITWSANINPNGILPPLDRAFTLLAILWIIWLWAFPEPGRDADKAALVLSGLIAAGTVLSILAWTPQSSSSTYNQSRDDLLWQAASLGLILIGVLLLFVRKTQGFVMGLAVLGIAFLGHTAYLLMHEDGNYSGVIRLAYIAVYPILLTLPQRFQAVDSITRVDTAGETSADQLEKRNNIEQKTLQALLGLGAELDAAELSKAITRAVAQTMRADLCYLVHLTDNKTEMVITCGYDQIRDQKLDGGSINQTAIPKVINAIQRGRPLRLPSTSTSADIMGLAEILGLNTIGSILSVPIIAEDKESLGGLILLTPYSNRQWNAEDQAYLANIALGLVPVIRRGRRVTKLEEQIEQAGQTLYSERGRIAELERRNDDLALQIEAMTVQSERDATAAGQLAELTFAQEESQRTIDQLEQELRSLKMGGRGTDAHWEKELSESLQDVARLQNLLADSNRKILELEKNPNNGKSEANQEYFKDSISQQLRQPISSVIGYSDLLLGESVGILGALQRKFVERIKASTELISSLVNDVTQINLAEIGKGDPKSEAMDLNLIIDNALAYTSSQVREKNISMHLELPKKIARVNADREALQQILIHLLQNAGSATPVEGTIRLKVQTTTDDGQAYVLIQVTDSGGGISEEDIPRVFMRLYRADNVLIQGVGDTGVGLSIAKTLTEAQHGRIWVESEKGTGTTFSVLLPIEKEVTEKPPKKETA